LCLSSRLRLRPAPLLPLYLVGAYMKFTRVIALAVIAASTGVAGLHAQNLRSAGQPAEFPPASYKSTQYIDSRGCVFVRAGISGNVTWVPRVTRSRNQICNQQPSLTTRAAAAAPAAAAKAPVQITIDQPVAAKKPKVAAASKPKVRKPAAVAAVRKPIVRKPILRKAPVKVAAAAAPIKIVPAKTSKVAQAKPTVRVAPAVRRQTACAGASALSQQYLAGANVRCGPQTQAISSGRRIGSAQAFSGSAQGNNIDGATRVVPKHVLIQRQNTQNLPVPKGYRRVWEDDRLNPNRAEQSLAGVAAVKLIWTSTVPRRLINQSSGRDVTASVPLVYPYLDVATQTRDLGVVSIVRRDGQVLKRIQRNTARAYTPARQPTLSSRSAPKPVAKAPVRATPKASASQVIQVGTYGTQANAQTVAKRLKRMGVPVRIGKYTRGAKTYRMVLVGPFGQNATKQLSAVRRAGYSDAFLRN
jgi:hypothetical protein